MSTVNLENGFVVWHPSLAFHPKAPKYHHKEKRIRIYVLCDPRDNTVRYVGVTSNPERRLHEHYHDGSPHNPRMRHWIATLRNVGARPTMHLVASCFSGNWQKAERRWISFFRRFAGLYNIHKGGLKTWQPLGPRPQRRPHPNDFICRRKIERPNLVARMSTTGIVLRNVNKHARPTAPARIQPVGVSPPRPDLQVHRRGEFKPPRDSGRADLYEAATIRGLNREVYAERKRRRA